MDSQVPADREARRDSLRARARRAMQAEVGDAAFALFLRQGFDRTTVDQILAAAGVSRSTFFRYFPTKEDVVVGNLEEWGRTVLLELQNRPSSEDPWTSLRHALGPLLSATSGDPAGARAVMRMLDETPSLKARHHEKIRHWQSLLVPEIARRMGAEDRAGTDPRPTALVAAVLGCFDAATAAWVIDPGTGYDVLLDEAVRAVRP